jgi:hypothetical protein
VTELTQPLAATAARAPTTTAPAPAAAAHSVTFSELVFAHLEWWRHRQDASLAATSSTAFDEALNTFQQRHGEIICSYWCSHIESAVALTERRRLHGWLYPVYSFHRESDWATHDSPDVAAELHRCDELAVRAKTVLTGVRQRICMQLVMASASHLLSLVDARARHADREETAAALERERGAITKAESYYHEAANGQAQMIYFGGMAGVTVALAILAAIWLAYDWASPLAALIAGAIGAVVSVIQRINSGKFSLEYDVGGPYAFFLGGLRPLIGGAFAMAISFAFTGGLLHLPVAAAESSPHRRLALLVLGFVAGFSERWAQDTLTSILPSAHVPALPTGAGKPQPQPPEHAATTGKTP